MIEQDLLEPSRLYKLELKQTHHERVCDYFERLTQKAGTDVGANKSTCDRYYAKKDTLKNLQDKLGNMVWLAILFGILCLVIVGIFLFIYVYKPRKKRIQAEIEKLEKEIAKLNEEAWAQMSSLNELFSDDIPAKLFQESCPLIKMDRNFDIKKYEMLTKKYGMWSSSMENRSVLNLQTGSILGNPFVFFKDKVMNMRPFTYVGTRVVTYTRVVRTKDGSYTTTVTETLRATVTKPKPEYSNETYLVYGNQAAPHLTFTRGPSQMRGMDDEKKREKYVRHHEDDLRKLAQKQMSKGGNYTPLGNPLFELSFGGLDRNNEVEYRLLFTPLAQKAMIDLLFSNEGFGDDLYMKKDKCINIIESEHMRGRSIFMDIVDFRGFDYEKVKDQFIEFCDYYFKAVFFDFAPLLSIPLYQQMKADEYIFGDSIKSQMTPFEHEMMTNRYNPEDFADPDSCTDIIYHTKFEGQKNGADQVHVIASSFRREEHVDMVPVIAGNGRSYMVPVTWYEYIPVTGEGEIQTANVGGDELSFRGIDNQNTIYIRGLIALKSGLNVDINNLKSLMAKKEN